MIELRTCGGIALTDGAGASVASVLAQPKRLALLAYLAVEGDQGGCSRDRLLALFWPDSDEERARAALRQAVLFLRRALGEDALIRHGEAVLALDPGRVACDAAACLRALRAGHDEAALALYRGEFLPGFSAAGTAPEFEQWIEDMRRRLAADIFAAALRAARSRSDAGHLPQALGHARTALVVAPDDESALRAVMQLMLRRGDRSGALAEYERFRERLAQSLQAEPGEETLALVRALRAASAPGAQDTAGDPAPLLGRDDEMPALEALVFAHRRVTVAGAGGVGKTTVARSLAHRVRGAFDDSVFIADLGPVSDPSLVATTVATTLRVRLGRIAPLDAIAQAIGSRRILVVLDNCEHVLRAAAEVVEVLCDSLPAVRFLATSQEPLNIAHEQVFRLSPLALPVEDSLPAARRAGAVALFESRATAADQHFALTEDNVATAIDICRRLDGIALAIELAAARLPLLGMDGLRIRLRERFEVLTAGRRLAPPRQQTLRAALEWSHALLSPDQQAVFRRLGVFAGGFSLEAAQQVAVDDGVDRRGVLEALGALVDKSLVVAEPDLLDEPRYRMLETMRQFALLRLEGIGEGDATRRRHLAAFVALAGQARSESYGQGQARMMRRLDLDLDNLLAAHAGCAEAPAGADDDLRLAIGLFRYWLNRALLELGQRFTREALERGGAQADAGLRREALTISGRLSAQVGLHDLAREAHEEAVGMARRIGAPQALAEALTWAGVFRVERGDLAGARARMEEALDLARRVGSDSEAFGAAALALGELERFEGHWDRARPLAEASLAIARRQGDLRRIATNLYNLMMIATAQGRTGGLRDMLLEAMALGEEVTVVYARGFPSMLCAALASLHGDWEQAARCEGAARARFLQLGWALDDPADRAWLESFSARIRAALGDAAYEEARDAGGALPADEALREVREYLK